MKKKWIGSIITSCLLSQSVFASSFSDFANTYAEENALLLKHALELVYVTSEPIERSISNFDGTFWSDLSTVPTGNLGFQIRDYDQDGKLELFVPYTTSETIDGGTQIKMHLSMYEVEQGSVILGDEISVEIDPLPLEEGYMLCYSIQDELGGYQIGIDVWDHYTMTMESNSIGSGLYAYDSEGWYECGYMSIFGSDIEYSELEELYTNVGIYNIDGYNVINGYESAFDYHNGAERIVKWQNCKLGGMDGGYQDWTGQAAVGDSYHWGQSYVTSYGVSPLLIRSMSDDAKNYYEWTEGTATLVNDKVDIARIRSYCCKWYDETAGIAMLEVTPWYDGYDEVGYRFHIDWRDSANTRYCWDLFSTWDETMSCFTYSDGYKYKVTIDEEGNEETEYLYYDGSGSFEERDDGLYWNDLKENAGEVCVFRRNGSLMTGEEAAAQADYVYLDVNMDTQSIWGVYYLIAGEGNSCYYIYDQEGRYIRECAYTTAKELLDSVWMSEEKMLPNYGEYGIVLWQSPYGLAAYAQGWENYSEILDASEGSSLQYMLREGEIRRSINGLLGMKEIKIPRSDRTE